MAYNFNGWEPTEYGTSVGNLIATSAQSEGITGETVLNNPLASPSVAGVDHAELSNFYNTYSGVDISATIIIPGQSEPVTFANLRTISYSIVRDKRPLRILGSMNPICWAKSNRLIAGTLIFTSLDKYVWFQLTGTTYESSKILLADMLPPFDITITALNEYGSASRMSIRGVRIVDEGAVMGIDDLYIEVSHTWVAQDIVPWVKSNIESSISDNLK
jgi:hypothetical protein